MTTEEYAQQVIQTGGQVHLHAGIWWQSVKPYYCWPVDLFHNFSFKSVRPLFTKSFLGYEYMLPQSSLHSNAHLSMMVFEKDEIVRYGFESLSAKKRNQVRRGLENVLIQPVVNKHQFIFDGHQINRSALRRQERLSARIPIYSSLSDWSRTVNMFFDFHDREIWGAFYNNQLISYIRSVRIEDTIYITNAMSHTDYLAYYPNDALLYSYILHIKKSTPRVSRIAFGLYCNKLSINRFKEQIGFKKKDYPVFRRINPLIFPFIPFTKYKHYVAR